jgi:tRNA(Arg) A34 adenosine deaminase TadA
MFPMEDSFLEAAIEEAQQGMREGGIPIGSVIIHGGKIIGRGHNRPTKERDTARRDGTRWRMLVASPHTVPKS